MKKSAFLPPATLCAASILILSAALSGCLAQTPPAPTQPPLKTVEYSNLTDQASQDLLAELLTENGIEDQRSKALLDLSLIHILGAIVLECTNMPPYAKAIHEATGLPVYDITTLANYVMDGAARKPI